MPESNVIPFKTDINEMTKAMMSNSKFFMGYSRYDEDRGRYETWQESVERVIETHRRKYADVMTPELDAMLELIETEYTAKNFLGAQRALQFGGDQLLDKNPRLYNCYSSHVDRPNFFEGAMHLLLCGGGVGFSVQKHHVAQLPKLHKRYDKKSKVFKVPDSIEGWAQAFAVLLSSFFEDGGQYPEYKGCQVHFDLSEIRPKGAYISGGFKAPGPDGLRQSLQRCEDLLTDLFKDGDKVADMRPIIAYDFTMHMADAVLSGGIRRSATICLFSKDDEEMLKAKTGNWLNENPQRGRSNNSVVLKRGDTTQEEFDFIMQYVKEFGEPGFVFVESYEHCFNPCVEIGMYPKTVDGRSGFQACNLVEINGAHCNSREDFLRFCRAAAAMSTLQAGYTDFPFMKDATQEIIEREALLGVSITGWMNNPDVLFDEQNMKDGAEIVKQTNKEVAKMIGINPAARTTCVKPSGNASVLLGTASGIHGEHAPQYIRNMQMTETDEVLQMIEEVNPEMVEKSVWSSTGTDKVVSFPIVSKEGSIYKKDLLGVKQLEYVKKAQQAWVEHGTDESLCVDPTVRHNVSNTITVDDWDEVQQYIFENQQWFAGISFMSAMGDKAFPQAPFMEVFNADELVERYGDAAMFASGLIVEGLKAFDNNLWNACNTALGFGEELDPESSDDLMKRDWCRRAEKFAKNFFIQNGHDLDVEDVDDAITLLEGMQEMVNCLKDCHTLHKWNKIKRNIQNINFASELQEKTFTEVDTMGAQACQGGACEINI